MEVTITDKVFCFTGEFQILQHFIYSQVFSILGKYFVRIVSTVSDRVHFTGLAEQEWEWLLLSLKTT